jgi:hypothetical protein
MKLVQKYEPGTFTHFPLRTASMRAARRARGVRETIEDGADTTLSELLGPPGTRATVEDGFLDFDSMLNEDGSPDLNIFGEPIVRGGAVRQGLRRRETNQWGQEEIVSNTTGAVVTLEDELFLEGDGPVPRTREREGSPEEQARRRRRREAIVLNEGNRPLRQEDIIQRRRTETE